MKKEDEEEEEEEEAEGDGSWLDPLASPRCLPRRAGWIIGESWRRQRSQGREALQRRRSRCFTTTSPSTPNSLSSSSFLPSFPQTRARASQVIVPWAAVSSRNKPPSPRPSSSLSRAALPPGISPPRPRRGWKG